ncbi:MAG: amino acid ABC transporter permease [Magnetococcales bacterium]|nr:amino acid ABC transporter permease [Magnetococcales bacterium]
MNYHWNWAIFLEQVPSGETSYGIWLLQGLQWTLSLSLTAWLLALLLGITMGILRTLPQRGWRWIGGGYIELFRNIPLLVQLFLWYFVLPELLPLSWGNAIKRWHPLAQQFFAAWLCLGCFTAARIAEQVRAGIQALPSGQQQAGLALGLTLAQTYRYVLMPAVLRLILPPLTSEFLNIFKNSAVATTIGLIELSHQAQQLVDYTAQPYEAFIAVTLLYVLINAIIMVLMRRVESKVAMRLTTA